MKQSKMPVDPVLVAASAITIRRPSAPTAAELRQPGGRRRLALAYGKWTMASGREVVHNRRYRPLWQREGAASPWGVADYAEFVRDIVAHEWFYDDGHTEREKTRRAIEAMARLGISIGRTR